MAPKCTIGLGPCWYPQLRELGMGAWGCCWQLVHSTDFHQGI